MSAALEGHHYLVCRSGSRILALPLSDVIETMRPLPIQALAGTPAFILGLSMVRGIATPVVDTEVLFDAASTSWNPGPSRQSRFVSIAAGARTAALLVDEVQGVRHLPPATRAATPPLIENAVAGSLSEVGAVDQQLLLVLTGARLISEATWDAIRTAGTPR